MKDILCSNPILPGFHPDPSILRVDEDYYLVNSTFAYFPGVPIFHSRDLIHWEQIGNVLDRREQLDLTNAKHSHGIYAPTLRYHNGVFYMITTNVGNGGNFIVTAENPAGPWSAPYFLNTPGIDPSLFFDDDGRCYFCGTKDRREGSKFWGDNEIYIQELDLNTMKLIGDSYPAWHGALRDAAWAEGPHLYKKDGYYYLMIAEGGTGIDHAITIAKSKDLKLPFEGCKRNPILTHRHLGKNYPIINTGHGDLVCTQNNEWYMVLLACRPCEGYSNLGRETFLVPVAWEDGWPVVNPGKGIVEAFITMPDLPIFAAQKVDEKEDFNSTKLPYCFMTLRNRDFDCFDLQVRPGYVTMPLLEDTLSDKGAPAALFVRQTAFDYVLETKLSFLPHTEHEEAGLTLYQSNEFYYRFYLTLRHDKLSLELTAVEQGKEAVLYSQPISIDNTEELILHVSQIAQNLSFSYRISTHSQFTYIADADASMLSTERASGFVGTCLGIYASSNQTASTNYAAFDYLLLENK